MVLPGAACPGDDARAVGLQAAQELSAQPEQEFGAWLRADGLAQVVVRRWLAQRPGAVLTWRGTRAA